MEIENWGLQYIYQYESSRKHKENNGSDES